MCGIDSGPGGAILARHFHGAVIDEVLATGKVNGPGNPVSTYYHQHDGLGSVTALTNETGAIEESYRYDVYGTPAIYDASLTLQPSSLASNRFLFTGREWLPALSLYDYRNRAYGPGIGRFLQTDPIRFDGGDVNLYGYVAGNPIRLIDPSGLTPCDCLRSIRKAKMLFDLLKSGNGAFTGKYQDKLAHCIAHCELARGCGESTAEYGGVVKEMLDEIQKVVGNLQNGNPPNHTEPGQGWDYEDISANDVGHAVALQAGSCKDLCEAKFPGNKLHANY